MKLKIAIPILLSALLGVWSAVAQSGDMPLQFTETEWDYGTIDEGDGAVTHRFTFRNTGHTPIAVDRVISSCGCTTPNYSRTPVQPSKEGAVTVNFDPTGYEGAFSKSVVVLSGGGKWRNTLIIKGVVTPREKTIEELYPFDLGGGVRIDNNTLAFRQIAQGQTSSMTVGYINTSDSDISIEVVEVERSGLLEARVPQMICGGCSGNMTFTYNLSNKSGHYGMIHDLLQFSVDGTHSAQGIYATMIGVDDFSTVSIEDAPKMTLSAQYHNFGDVRRRAIPYAFNITLRNDGSRTLHIRSVSEKAGLKTTIYGGMTIAAGASLPFELLLYGNKYPSGELFDTIIITTDDPLRPVRELRISAKVK
jgi:hypothetical protein